MSDKAKKTQKSKVAGKAERPEGEGTLKVGSSQYIGKGRQCRATSKATGERCRRMAMNGLLVCIVHGGATRRAKTAAATRIAEASGYAADMLVEFMADPAVGVDLRTKIAQDLLNRAGVSAATILKVEADKKFEDVLESVLVEVPDGADPNVIEAEVVEDDGDSDALIDREQERARRRRKGLPPARDDVQTPRQPVDTADRAAKLAAERANLERSPAARAVRAEKAAATRRGREAYLTALDRGASPMEADRIGERVARGEPPVPGARVSKAQMRRG